MWLQGGKGGGKREEVRTAGANQRLQPPPPCWAPLRKGDTDMSMHTHTTRIAAAWATTTITPRSSLLISHVGGGTTRKQDKKGPV